MFMSGQVNFLSQLVLGQVDFCNISTALNSDDEKMLIWVKINGYGLFHRQLIT